MSDRIPAGAESAPARKGGGLAGSMRGGLAPSIDKGAEMPVNSGESVAVPPILNNMGGLNHQSRQKPNKTGVSCYVSKFWAGIDQLTLTYLIDWGANWDGEAVKKTKIKGIPGADGSRPVMTLVQDVYWQLRERLDAYHLAAMAASEPVEMKECPGVTVHPSGGSIGGKRCRFKLEMDACIILIADQQKYRGAWPNVKIEINGEHCLCYPGGADAAYLAGVFFLGSLGAEIHKERVNRVDICADFPGWSMQGFIGLGEARRWVCRSKKYLPRIYPTGSTLLWGEGAAIMLRIYDKLKEQEQKSLRGSPAKFLHMVEKRWGGSVPAQAVRVEYQLRRDALKTFGVTDFDSLFENMDEMLKYLTGEGATFDKWSKAQGKFVTQKNARWFRFLKNEQDKNHPERNVVNTRWAIVQKVFSRQRIDEQEPIREIQPEKADISALVKQAFGVMSTAASNRGYVMPGKKSTAPEKFRFGSYEIFEAWMCREMRAIAKESGKWDLREKDKYTAVDYEIDEIEFDRWLNRPLPDDVREMIELENAIEAEKEAFI